MKQYLDLMQKILDKGIQKGDRTKTGTLSIFGEQLRFDLDDGFPLVTTKKIHLKSVIYELLWFLNGDTNVKYLNDNGVHIWDEWANHYGSLGEIYGSQWRTWGKGEDAKFSEYDQIFNLVNELKNNPDSRRHVVSAWNVDDLDNMALEPCHCLFQAYVANNKLSIQVYQRSADVFIGLPFNIASYALLTQMIAQQCGFELGDLIMTLGDSHLYLNHLNQVKTQLLREPYELPKMKIKRNSCSIFAYQYDDFELIDYKYHPHIKAKVAV